MLFRLSVGSFEEEPLQTCGWRLWMAQSRAARLTRVSISRRFSAWNTVHSAKPAFKYLQSGLAAGRLVGVTAASKRLNSTTLSTAHSTWVSTLLTLPKRMVLVPQNGPWLRPWV